MRTTGSMLLLWIAGTFAKKGNGEGGHGGRNHDADEQSHPFRGIEQFITPEQEHAARNGNSPPDIEIVTSGKRKINTTDNTEVDRRGNWHSQAMQDKYVFTALMQKYGGFFVDLAANEPISLSNTRTLERDHGWNGVCVDGNQRMLEKLLIQRRCRVIKGVVSDVSGREVSFTSPLREGTWEDAMGGIVSDKTDNRQRRPEYAKRQWHVEKHFTVTLKQILDHIQAPAIIDYLSLVRS